MRTAFYVRVSTERQQQAQTIEQQLLVQGLIAGVVFVGPSPGRVRLFQRE